jgi:hypothetical protein
MKEVIWVIHHITHLTCRIYYLNLGTVTSIGLSGGTTGMTFLLPLQVGE